MKILLANDDGYQAPGIVAMYTALQRIGDVDVVAPHKNNSAQSNAITVQKPLYVRTASNGFRYINGTPADCVHIALTGLLNYRPDLVVSGINNGANMGDDTIYSGTVGAAIEGYLMGIPAIAISQVNKGWEHLEAAAIRATELIQTLLQHLPVSPGKAWLFNVNIPNRPLADLLPLRVCRLGKRHIASKVITQKDPFGNTMYWIGNAGGANLDQEDTDFCAAEKGHVVLTPLQIDLTDYRQLDTWRNTLGD